MRINSETAANPASRRRDAGVAAFVAPRGESVASPNIAPPQVAPVRDQPSAPPVYDARDIVGGSGVAEIQLDGQVYTLRITRQGKLLLTK